VASVTKRKHSAKWTASPALCNHRSQKGNRWSWGWQLMNAGFPRTSVLLLPLSVEFQSKIVCENYLPVDFYDFRADSEGKSSCSILFGLHRNKFSTKHRLFTEVTVSE
jgi:hypothetical protein